MSYADLFVPTTGGNQTMDKILGYPARMGAAVVGLVPIDSIQGNKTLQLAVGIGIAYLLVLVVANMLGGRFQELVSPWPGGAAIGTLTKKITGFSSSERPARDFEINNSGIGLKHAVSRSDQGFDQFPNSEQIRFDGVMAGLTGYGETSGF